MTPRRFCAICGKTIDNSSPNFGMCIECYLKEHPLFELPEKFSFKICNDCGSYCKNEERVQPKKREIESIIEEAIHRYLLGRYNKVGNTEFVVSFNQENFEYSSKGLLKSLNATINGFLKENPSITHQQTIQVNIQYELCKNCCNIKSGQFFISIMQLRVKNESYFEFLKTVIDEIYVFVEKLFEKDPKQFITKVEDQKNGVDLLLSSNELINTIVKHLKGKYNFELKRSKKLMGRDQQRSKDIYRLRALIKFLPLVKSDLIIINNKEYLVQNISNNKVLLRSKSGEKMFKPFDFFFEGNVIIKK